jgi:hypothetical protein
LASKTFDFFLVFKEIKRRGRPFSLSKQSSLVIQAPLSGHLFSQVVLPLAEITFSKIVAKFRGGGMAASSEGAT